MPRTDDLKSGVPIWASSGSAEKNLDTRSGEPALTATDGYTSVYAQQDGSKATYQQFNQFIYWLTRHIGEANAHGIFEWDAVVMYQHPALVFGANGRLYRSVQDSTNRNPTTDATDTYWTLVVPDDRLLPENNGPAHSYLAGTKQWGSLATDVPAAIPTRVVPTPTGHTGQYLAGNRTWLALRDELSDRLLPADAGADGTVLLGDKTFGTPPRSYTREELWFGDIAMRAGSQYNKYLGGPGAYNVNDWDEIQLYWRAGVDLNTNARLLFMSPPIHPELIPSAVTTASLNSDGYILNFNSTINATHGWWVAVPFVNQSAVNLTSGTRVRLSVLKSSSSGGYEGNLVVNVTLSYSSVIIWRIGVYGVRY